MKRIPIKSILYQLSIKLDPKNWNESVVLEWAIKAAKKMGSIHSLTADWILMEYDNGCFDLPREVESISQIFIFKNPNKTYDQLVDEIRQRTSAPNADFFIQYAMGDKNTWKSVYQAVTPIINQCTGIDSCYAQYYENNNHVRLNIQKGVVLVIYKKYATDSEGELEIPDNENYKEAINHYILYNYYDGLCNVEANQINMTQRKWHLDRFDFLQRKAIGEVNEPTEGQLENMRKYRNKLPGTLNMFEKGFVPFGTPTTK